MSVKVILADDHAIIRDGIQMIIGSLRDIEVIGTAVDGEGAVKAAEELHPDVVVMDIAMPGTNGIEATRIIRDRLPSVKVVILSMHSSREYVYQALQAGAQGYLLKHSDAIEIIKAIRTVARGHVYYGKGVDLPSESAYGDTASGPSGPFSCLSIRELEVLRLVVSGKTSKEIAELLFLSPKSVESYRSRLMKKLEVRNSTALIRFAISHGISVVV